jgi:putative transposase
VKWHPSGFQAEADKMINETLIWNQRHLQYVLSRYVEHYNAGCPHRGIDLEVPVPALRIVTAPPTIDDVARVDLLGGLVHEYRCAA